MGIFSKSNFEQGKDLYYQNPKAGLAMMEKYASSASEWKTLAFKHFEEYKDERAFARFRHNETKAKLK